MKNPPSHTKDPESKIPFQEFAGAASFSRGEAWAASRLQLINELSLKFQSLITSENIYQEIVELVQNRFHYYSFSIWSIQPDGSARIEAQSGAYNNYLYVGFSIAKEAGIVGTVVTTKKPYICNDVTIDSHFTKLSLPVDTKSQLSIPVLVDNTVNSVFSVEANEKSAFNEDDKLFFESLARQLAAALVNAKLYQEGKSLSENLQRLVDERTRELKRANDQILEQQRLLQKENTELKTMVDSMVSKDVNDESTIVVASPAMASVLGMVDKIAPTTATVLIQGESGTGKELVARRLHYKSERRNKPYVTINCGALQDNLLESELFGHEKGAFTGAHALKIGLCEMANGGTLFLDEIGEMSAQVQSKLLRFLQEGEIYRVGGKKPLHVDVRVVSATNRDLENEVQAGRFREDLYYRLNTITLRLPPLRKRREEIRPLIDFFLKQDQHGTGQMIRKIDPRVYEILENYEWPGNIRELENTIERMKILVENYELRVEDIPLNIRVPRTGAHHQNNLGEMGVDLSLDDLEKQHILRTLAFYNNNKTRAAASLGITIKTLYNKLHRYGLIKELKDSDNQHHI